MESDTNIIMMSAYSLTKKEPKDHLQSKESIDRYRNLKIIIVNIIIGQILAILAVENAIISKVIEKDWQIIIPLLLTSSYYFLLGLFWFLYLRKLKFPKFYYILITIFDSQANFMNIYAFSVVNFNYPFIIGMSTVFWTCLFTWIFIRNYSYKLSHFLGVTISLLGVGITLYGTLLKIDDKEAIFVNAKGLVFCIAASICYSISSILQEIHFKSEQDIYEFFPWLGIIGSSLTFFESFFLNEIPNIIYKYEITVEVILLWVGFAISLVVFTSIAPFYIKKCSASMFNFSQVSQIFWSYLVEIIFNEASPKGYEYYIGFVIIIIGIFLFNKYPVTKHKFKNGDVNSRKNSDLEREKSLRQKLIDKEDRNIQGLKENDASSLDKTIYHGIK